MDFFLDNQMTDELKARIEEIRNRLKVVIDRRGAQETYVENKLLHTSSALLAVLEIKTFADIPKEAGNFDRDFQDGYNQALADVRAQIEGAMEK
jgi:hypothetical protein